MLGWNLNSQDAYAFDDEIELLAAQRRRAKE
jgi:hypothetical protein